MENYQIIKEQENPLFKRKEIVIIVKSEITPSSIQAMEFIAKKLSVDAGAIKIKKIAGKFGAKEFLVTANVYLSKEDLDKTEIKPKEKKK